MKRQIRCESDEYILSHPGEYSKSHKFMTPQPFSVDYYDGMKSLIPVTSFVVLAYSHKDAAEIAEAICEELGLPDADNNAVIQWMHDPSHLYTKHPKYIIYTRLGVVEAFVDRNASLFSEELR